MLTHFSKAEQERAMKRFNIIRPFLEGEASLVQVVQTSHVPLRTARRWVSQYRNKGMVGLIHSSRSDRGVHPILSTEMQQLIEGLALCKPPLTAAAIHRKVVQWAKQQGQPYPSYSTVYALMRRLDPGLMTLAHQGSKAYSETFDLLYRHEAEHPNQIWQADHTLLDLWLRNDQGQPERPWLTIIIDDYSRAIAGYYLSFSAPSAYQTALALRQAIWRKDAAHWLVCGIPAVLYTDHGSDFTSNHIEQVCADLKIRLIFSQVGKPRGRGKIERFFETVNQVLLSSLAGYTPSGSKPPTTPSLTLVDLTRSFETFLQDYHQRPQRDLQEAPQPRWVGSGFLPHLPESLEVLDLLLLTVTKKRRIQQDGIRFQGLRYIDPLLAAYVGEDVLLRYDPRDMAEIRIYHHDRFLCRAICPDLATEQVSLKEIVAARNQRRKALKQKIQHRTSLVDALMGAKAAPFQGQDQLSSDPVQTPTPPSKSSLKRYLND